MDVGVRATVVVSSLFVVLIVDVVIAEAVGFGEVQ